MLHCLGFTIHVLNCFVVDPIQYNKNKMSTEQNTPPNLVLKIVHTSAIEMSMKIFNTNFAEVFWSPSFPPKDETNKKRFKTL